MRALEFLRDPFSPASKAVYVVYGDDVYLRREAAGAIGRAILGDEADEMAVRRFEGNSASLADVLDELRMLPFFSRRRVVFVEDADPFVTKNRKELEAHVEAPVGTGVLVLMVKSWPANTKLYRQVAAAGLPIDCNSPGEKELHPVARAPCGEAGGRSRSGRGAAAGGAGRGRGRLARRRGREAGRLRRSKRPDPPGRRLPDGRGRQDRDGLESDRRRDHGESWPRPSPTWTTLLASGEHPIKILAAFSASLLKVHHAGRLRAARLSLAEACQIAGIRDFAVDKTRRQHAHLGPARVDQLPAWLLKADLDLKGNSLLDPRVILEDLLIRLALPRKD